MSSCKGLKRWFELEPTASCQQEQAASIFERNQVKTKRQRTGLENTEDNFEDNFEEFVALLDRIKNMKAGRMNLGIWEPIFMPAEDLDVLVIKTKSPWIPSFQWQDFCVSEAVDAMSAQTDICSLSTKNDPSSSQKKGKQSAQLANHLNRRSFSLDAYDNRPNESLDLNVEARS